MVDVVVDTGVVVGKKTNVVEVIDEDYLMVVEVVEVDYSMKVHACVGMYHRIGFDHRI